MRAMRQRRLLLRLTFFLLTSAALHTASANPVSPDETDGPNNRKLLGSSVVTSVSVIMDHPNGTKTYITDGEPPEPPSVVGSPAALMSPDRYEFYSFGKDGELVKKLMTLDQIQGLIAGGDELNAHVEGGQAIHFYQQPLVQAGEPEGVNKVLESVQNVLKSEMQTAHIPDHLDMPPVGDDSWSILLPGFLNSELDFKETLKTTSKPTSVSKRPVNVPPPFPPTTSSTTVPTTVQAVKVTTPRHPMTTSPPKPPQRPSSQTTIRRPPQSPATTVKYSAHYSTTPPNLKLQNKPATVVKKPTGTMPKPPQQPLKTAPTTRPTSARPSNFTSSERPKVTVTVTPPRRVQNVTEPNTTFRPTTAKGTTERMRPSGIPTITHYLPIQTSVGPSEAVKTTKPAVPTKPTVKTTPKPVSKPPKPYVKTQPTTTIKATERPTTTVKATEAPTTINATERPSTLPTTNVPVAEKLVQKTPGSVLDAASSDMISVSVSTPSGPPSTLKVTAATTPRPISTPMRPMSTPMRPMSTPMRPMSTPVRPMSTPTRPLSSNTAPVVAIQQNRTKTTPKPVMTTHKNVVTNQPRPTPSVSSSSVATHKPVVVLSNKPFDHAFDRPFVKIVPNATYAAIMAAAKPPTTTTKVVPPTMTTQSRLPTTVVTQAPTTVVTQPPTTVVTQPPTTAAPATTNQEFSTTLSNELDQAPMKLAAGLKDPEQNVFEKVPLMSTTLRDVPTIVSTIMTTEGTTKWEQIPNATTQNGATTSGNFSTTTTAGNVATTTGNVVTTPGDIGTTAGNTGTTAGNDGTTISDVGTTISNVGTTTAMVRTTTPPVDLRTVTANGEPSTVTMAASTIVTTDSPPTTFNKVYIINNSEPQTFKLPLTKSSTEKRTGEETASTIFDWIGSRTEATQTTENSQATSTTTEAPSTITESPSSTTFKDQVMEEGMSAVASILLDDNKSVVEKNTVAERLTVSETSATTELTTVTRGDTTVNDGPAFREEPDERDRASTRRDDNSWKTTTSLTTAAETTTSPPIFTTNKVAPGIKKPATEKKKIAVKRDELAPPALPVKSKPIKESKLNPDSDEQPQESQPQAQAVSTEGTTMMMEQVKLTEKGPATPASPPPPPPPPAPSVKIPLQEPKVPPPALKRPSYSNEVTPPPAIDLHPAPYESMGAEASTAFLAEDVRRFADLCNELAFRLWTALTAKGEKGQISSRSLVMSPFAAVSLLAMVFLGARGATSGQMNEILRLDDMVTFNPHQVLQNVTDSVISSRNVGVATAAFVRQLYSDKSKGKILDFYKERAQQYYGGHVEEVSFSTVGDVVRRRTNLLVKRQTLGKVPEYLRGSSLNLRPPLAAFSANIFQTDCDSGSTDGRDGEMYFVVRPSTRQRRLVPVPAVVWRTGFSAGYEPSLDATSVCLAQDSVVSTLLILPGQQGQVAPGDGLARLEQRLIETSYRRGGWSRLLRSLLPRPGLELQVPRFSHRSVLNVTSALGRMGLRDLFSFKADLRGLNGGATELHLSDMVQVNTFSTCGEEVLGARHHIETYPSSPTRSGREDALPNYLDDEPHYEPRRPRFHFNGDDVVDGRPRTGRLPLAAPSTDPAPPRLRFDRPFLYIVRHNPSGIILHIGRFNPRLLP